MKLIIRFFLSAMLALVLAFALDFYFFNLSGRTFIEQTLLLFFPTAALTYVIFSILGMLEARERPLPQINIQLNRSAAAAFFREHLPGLLLALVFFSIYLSIGLRLNRADLDTTDNYLDADNSTWMSRIAEPNGSSIEMRGPHPFAYLIFRPLGWFLNLFTHNYALSATILNTFAGALCVFMAWVFVKRQFQNANYALLIAGLLGLSTAHIFFGSIVESYIFSAATLIGFQLLLQSQKPMGVLVSSSLLTFGITLTNTVQNFISLLVTRPRWRELFSFAAWTISLGIILGLVHAIWYPSSKLFFLLSGVQAEQQYSFSIFSLPAWRAMGRVILLIRTILLYTVIAPEPHVFGKDVGGAFPRFNFFKISPGTFAYSHYDGLGNLLVLTWAAMLFAAGLIFLWNMVRLRKIDMSLAFALCLLFNFLLHLSYGYEPFLYSADWAYALIFFVAFGLAPLAKNLWFQSGLFVFLLLLAYNQFQFFAFIFQQVSPFFK